MNTKMYLYDGTELFPPWMSEEAKVELKKHIGNRRDAIYCACKSDVPDEDKLYYRISADNRFIPCCQGYKHSPDCSRYSDKRNSAYISLDSSEGIVTYLKFNPLNYSVPRIATKEESSSTEEPTPKTETKKIKEPYLSLPGLIRCLNIDSYMDRLIASGNVLSRDYFLSVIRARTKKITIAGQNKSLRELSLKEDRCSFFYSNFKSLEKNNNGYWELKIEINNKVYSYGIAEELANKVLLEFAKAYSGDSPNNCKDVMVSGFIYKRVSRRTWKDYYTIGRLHLFKTTKHEGIYCSNNIEKQVFELFFEYIHHSRKPVKLHIPVQQEDFICQIKSDKNTGYIFLDSIPTNLNIGNSHYIECKSSGIQPEDIVDLIDKL